MHINVGKENFCPIFGMVHTVLCKCDLDVEKSEENKAVEMFVERRKTRTG